MNGLSVDINPQCDSRPPCHGELDPYALRSSQERLLEVLRDARFLEYKGAGHAFHWEDPETLVLDLPAFLDESLTTTERARGDVYLVSG